MPARRWNSPSAKAAERKRASCSASDLALGERPQIVVPATCWQTAKSLGRWTLCGCTVAPGFEFSQFELAEPGWEPDGETG